MLTWARVEDSHPFGLNVEPTHKLDVLGHYCPVPVSQARKALTKLESGNVLVVIADDPETMHDLPMLIERMGHKLLEVDNSSGEFKFLIEVCQ